MRNLILKYVLTIIVCSFYYLAIGQGIQQLSQQPVQEELLFQGAEEEENSPAFPIFNQEMNISGRYRLRNVWTEKYLSQEQDSEGAFVSTYGLNTDWLSQIWLVQQGEDGTYRLECKWRDWFLNIDATDNGTRAHVYPLNETWDSQMWYLENQGNNTFRIKNRWSDRYLNATSSETTNIYDLQEDWQSQLWVLESIDDSTEFRSTSDLANPNANSKTVEVYNKLTTFQTATDQCLLLGQNIGWSLEEYEPLVQELENITGKKLGLIGGQLRYAPNEMDVPNIVQLYSNWQREGGIVELSMLPNNPLTGGSAWDLSNTEIWKLTTPGEAGYDAWRIQLDYFAGILKELENAGVTVIWRPLMEMNGDWFWFGYQGQDNQQDYINLYRDLFNYFTNTWELNNLIWMYSANASYAGIPSVDHYYPGDDVVDMTGIDVYINGLELPASQYQTMVNYGKPFALTEFGPHHEDMDGSHDYHQYVNTIINNFPKAVYALAWHSWPDHKVAFLANQNYQEALNIPCIVERTELNLITSTETNNHAFQNNTLKIFPNPASDYVMLSLQKAVPILDIQLIDATGRSVAVNYSSKSSTLYQLNWGDLPAGLYFVTIKTEQERYGLKVKIP